jgi:hypothetical protein
VTGRGTIVCTALLSACLDSTGTCARSKHHRDVWERPGYWLKHNWYYFVVACDLLNQERDLFGPVVAGVSEYNSGYQHAISIAALCEELSDNGAINFQVMLFHNKAYEATDPRDRVYAVLGLVGEQAYGVDPDYTLDKSDAFRHAVRVCIERSRSLDIMSACQDTDWLSSLPSWVPNWEADWKVHVLRQKQGGENLYHATDSKPASISFSEESGRHVLAVEGISGIQ